MVKAHIFPRALIHEMKDGHQVIYAADATKRGYREYQSGPWDSNILCQICEAKLSVFDDYAIRWIRKFEQRAIPIFGGKGFEVPNTKSALLVGFAAATLWRAAVSELRQMPSIDLGPFEPPLRKMLFAEGLFEPRLLIFRKVRHVDGVPAGMIVAHPYHAPGWGRRAYAFEVGGFLWGIRLDSRQRGADGFFSPISINGRDTAVVPTAGPIEMRDDQSILDVFAAAEGLTRKLD